jgi:hypothetical protein
MELARLTAGCFTIVLCHVERNSFRHMCSCYCFSNVGAIREARLWWRPGDLILSCVCRARPEKCTAGRRVFAAPNARFPFHWRAAIKMMAAIAARI